MFRLGAIDASWRLLAHGATYRTTPGANSVDFSVQTGINNAGIGGAGGLNSFAEGAETMASGSNSHAEGYETIASGLFSHSEGNVNIAQNEGSHASGKFNIGTAIDTIHETGIGVNTLNRKMHLKFIQMEH